MLLKGPIPTNLLLYLLRPLKIMHPGHGTRKKVQWQLDLFEFIDDVCSCVEHIHYTIMWWKQFVFKNQSKMTWLITLGQNQICLTMRKHFL